MKRSAVLAMAGALAAIFVTSGPAAALRGGEALGRAPSGRSVALHQDASGSWIPGWGWNRWSGGWPADAGWGPGPGVMSPRWGYSAPYGYPYGIEAGPAPSLTAGRSAAQIGRYCVTPAKTCRLGHASWVGSGCSCRLAGGRERGSVTP